MARSKQTRQVIHNLIGKSQSILSGSEISVSASEISVIRKRDQKMVWAVEKMLAMEQAKAEKN